MIKITRLNGTKLYINAELIQSIEATPDTTITLSNGVKIITKDPLEAVVKQIIEYQRLVHNPQIDLEQGA